jgi:hypothetical protein
MLRICTTTLLSLVLPLIVFAKGDTIRVVIRGATLSAPIEISNPALIDRFNVWSGPGTFPTVPEEGLNVDWPRGVAHAPEDLEKYTVSFVTTRSHPSTYVVHYEVDPVTKQGYVYIPGKDDPAYGDNVWLIYRGMEGNWFYASKTWQALADPLISKNRKVVRTESK